MRKYLLLLAAVAFVAAPRPAHAGYQVDIQPTIVDTPDTNGDGMATPGETFSTANIGGLRGMTSGLFANFLPDGPSDPQIHNSDLGLYGFELNGTVQPGAAGLHATYAGTYAIRYFDPSTTIYDVSLGNFSIDATFNQNGVANLVGTLTQTAGPSNPAFADLGYCGPVNFVGTYSPNQGTPTAPRQGTISGRLSCVVPEPSSLAFLAAGLLPLLGLRRRK